MCDAGPIFAFQRRYLDFLWSGRRDSNPRPSPRQGDCFSSIRSGRIGWPALSIHLVSSESTQVPPCCRAVCHEKPRPSGLRISMQPDSASLSTRIASPVARGRPYETKTTVGRRSSKREVVERFSRQQLHTPLQRLNPGAARPSDSARCGCLRLAAMCIFFRELPEPFSFSALHLCSGCGGTDLFHANHRCGSRESRPSYGLVAEPGSPH